MAEAFAVKQSCPRHTSIKIICKNQTYRCVRNHDCKNYKHLCNCQYMWSYNHSCSP